MRAIRTAAKTAKRVAGRPLDLDHVGSEVAEQHGGQGRGDRRSEFDDANPIEHRHCGAHRLKTCRATVIFKISVGPSVIVKLRLSRQNVSIGKSFVAIS
jgi:hypothetical protein